MPERRPLSPSATASTSGGPGSEVKTTSDASATARGLSAHTTPFARYGSAAARRRSCTTRSWPAFCRLAAMPEPIMPKPIKPIFITPSRDQFPGSRRKLLLLEHLFGDEGGSHCRRPPGVKREMGDDFTEFVF